MRRDTRNHTHLYPNDSCPRQKGEAKYSQRVLCSVGGDGELGCDDDMQRLTWDRICPGRYLAQSTMWLVIASILTTFDICKPVDAGGEEFDPPIEFETTLTRSIYLQSRTRFANFDPSSHPKPFPCIFKPRSAKSISLMRQKFQTYHPSSQ